MTGPMKFGDYLKNRRAELGWTQPEAAAKAAQFHQTFPRSLLGPTVDAALAP